MHLNTSKILLIMLVIVLVKGEEWFMPNSNLISDKEFPTKIKKDTSTFKFVKFFTPHCPYCRYLKAVFDKLKPEREWAFKVYDFNCQWYHQFCMQSVKSTSFPYTVVYNEKG